MQTYGIDVSEWQKKVDFNKVKAAGKTFVLIKAGFGRYAYQKDPYFESNYKNAKAAGLNVGAYWYSYAVSSTDAVQEAKACLEVIKGKQFDYPIYYDFEELSQLAKGKTFYSDCIDAFCRTLQQAGYMAGLYIFRSGLQNYVTDTVANKYELAISEYASKLNYNKPVGIWQYAGNEGRCDGVSGAVDLDVCYKDYPSVIKAQGLNGFKAVQVKLKTLDQIAKEVIQGLWGAGEERKKKLTTAGYNYNTVQKRVNELLSGVSKPKLKSIDEIAKEVIRGDWGAGAVRKKRLEEAGYDYKAVQKRVNEMLK